MTKYRNSFNASGNKSFLLITFANSLNPDQDQQYDCPDLGSNRLTLRPGPTVCLSWSWFKPLDTQMPFIKEFKQKMKKSQQMTTKECKITKHANHYIHTLLTVQFNYLYDYT